VKPATKETVKMLIIGFVLMMALPVAYRIWLIYHPQPVVDHTSVTQFLERSVAERPVRLLKTPVGRWTDYDKNTEPKIYAWQIKHEKTILPWDWTEEAKRKDPNGFVGLWSDLFVECESELCEQAKRLKKDIKALDRRARINETIYVHDTNQLALIGQCLKTNAFPLTIQIQRLNKGRLWGWNTKIESFSFTNMLEVCDEIKGRGWLLDERERINKRYLDLVNDKSELVSHNNNLLDVSKRLDVVRQILNGFKSGGSQDCKSLEVVLSKIIRKDAIKLEDSSCTK